MNNLFNLKLLLTGTIVSVVIMLYTGYPLKKSSSDFKSILSLEFANSSSKVEAIINAWQAENSCGKPILHYSKINTYWDFLFIFFYSTSLFFAHQSMAKPAKREWQIIFSLAGNAALVAGALDIIENIGMLRSMNLLITDLNAQVTATCAKIKFILLGLSISLLILRWIIKGFKHRNPIF